MEKDTYNSSYVSNNLFNGTKQLSISTDNNTYSQQEISLEELYNYIYPQTFEWILIAVYSLTFVVGVTGNILVCFAVWMNKDLRTITNIFMVNLSIADLLIIIFCLPSGLLVDVTATWFLGLIPCKLHIFLATLTISVSVMTLCAISVERWYAICHPLRFHSTVRRARYIIAGIWITSACIAIPELITSTVIPLRPDTVLLSSCYPALWEEKYIIIFQICLMVTLYFLPIALMAFSYIHISLVLWRSSISGSESIELGARKPMIDRSLRVHENVGQIESRRKAVRMLVAVVVVFALCFLPNHTLNIIRYTGQLQKVPYKRVIALFAHWATFFNSCINPVIYNFMSESFRKAFKEVLLRSCFRCRTLQKHYQRTSSYKTTFSATKYGLGGLDILLSVFDLNDSAQSNTTQLHSAIISIDDNSDVEDDSAENIDGRVSSYMQKQFGSTGNNKQNEDENDYQQIDIN